ncbi:MAG TPA: CVNH domain-containing protein [Thermoanaerobaculia bacterium]|jgi:hypothetical protein|nr:CVNH domain-containing protein [Thermoanaerobaculia bacterium]
MNTLPSRPAAFALAGSLIVALAAIQAAAQAQTLPPGTYQASCKDAALVDGTLLAQCRMSDGSWRPTTLADAMKCNVDITNVNGRLECRPLQITPSTLPAGTYQQSCKDASVVDGTLLAVCKTASGDWRPTSLPNAMACKSDVANVDGKLECRRRTTEFEAGYGKFGDLCKGGTGTEFLKVRLGGQRDNVLKLTFDQPYTVKVLYIYLPKGTTVNAQCGSYGDGNAQFTYKELAE